MLRLRETQEIVASNLFGNIYIYIYIYICIFFAAISLFRSRLLSRATKILLYKKLIRPVVSYGTEAWTMTKKEEQALLIFERKICRRIYGPKYENGEWKSRTNRELEEV
jgi:hypothetical protein